MRSENLDGRVLMPYSEAFKVQVVIGRAHRPSV